MIERRSLQVRLKRVMIVFLTIIPVVLIIIMLIARPGRRTDSRVPRESGSRKKPD